MVADADRDQSAERRRADLNSVHANLGAAGQTADLQRRNAGLLVCDL